VSRAPGGAVGAVRPRLTSRAAVLVLVLGVLLVSYASSLRSYVDQRRHVADLEGANSLEFDSDAAHPVIATMADQEDIVAGKGDLGGTMRLGSYPANLVPGSLVAEAYGSTSVTERHRHRYEVNNAYRDALTKAGLVLSGTSPDGRLVEFVELPADVHPFYAATQAHPELKSRPTRAHPLFRAFVAAALDYNAAERLPVEIPDDRAPRDAAGGVSDAFDRQAS